MRLVGLAIAALSMVASACSRDAPLASCDDPLGGVYTIVDGVDGDGDGKQWMVIDNRVPNKPRTLEAFPLFRDVPPPDDATIEVAPRVIDLDADLSGVVRRRYQKGVEGCMSKVPARITSCSGKTIEIVLGEPAPPTGFGPCTYGRTESSRREKWQR